MQEKNKTTKVRCGKVGTMSCTLCLRWEKRLEPEPLSTSNNFSMESKFTTHKGKKVLKAFTNNTAHMKNK